MRKLSVTINIHDEEASDLYEIREEVTAAAQEYYNNNYGVNYGATVEDVELD